MRILNRLCVAIAVAALALVAMVGTSSATHQGETIQLSKSAALIEGETITINITGFTPGGVDGNHPNAKLVVAGQGEFNTIPDKLNFEEYASAVEVPIGADGTGSGQLQVYADHGTVQDGSTLNCATAPCWVVAVQEPFLPQPNYASQQITFGGAPAAAAPAAAAPAAGGKAPVTTAPPTTVAAAPVATVAPATTIATATTVITSAGPSTTAAPKRVETAEAASVKQGGADSSVLFGIIAVLAALIAGGGFLATRKKDWTPPSTV